MLRHRAASLPEAILETFGVTFTDAHRCSSLAQQNLSTQAHLHAALGTSPFSPFTSLVRALIFPLILSKSPACCARNSMTSVGDAPAVVVLGVGELVEVSGAPLLDSSLEPITSYSCLNVPKCCGLPWCPSGIQRTVFTISTRYRATEAR